MTDQSEGPAVEKVETCSRCGIAKPEHISHLWACCGDGPGYGDQIKPETVACLRRQLEAARAELATEREGRRHLEEAAELLRTRPTSSDGVLDLYSWMDEVEEWKKRDQSPTPAEAPSAEEPAPVAEAEGRVTHDEARSHIDRLHRAIGPRVDPEGISGCVSELVRYLVQQEQSEREAVELRKNLDIAEGQWARESKAANAHYERTKELQAKLSEAERKLARLHKLTANIVSGGPDGWRQQAALVLDEVGLSRTWSAEQNNALLATQEPTGGEPAKPAQQGVLDVEMRRDPRDGQLHYRPRETWETLDADQKPAQADQKEQHAQEVKAQGAEEDDAAQDSGAAAPGSEGCNGVDIGEGAPVPPSQSAVANPAGERGDFRVGQRVRFWMGRGTVDAEPASAGRTWVRLTESGALTCPETRLLEPDYEADPGVTRAWLLAAVREAYQDPRARAFDARMPLALLAEVIERKPL